MKLTKVSPSSWDDMCKKDSIRNDFVIPHLVRILNSVKPASVLDVGCGSGYITHQLMLRCEGMSICWRLLDSDRAMLAFAERRLSHLQNVETFGADIRHPQGVGDVPPSEFCFVVFSSLEFYFDEDAAGALLQLVKPRGAFVLFLPDLLTDVAQTLASGESCLRQYINGHCELKKTQTALAAHYPFHATRLEFVLSRILRAGATLTNIALETIHTNGNSQTFFAFQFAK